MGGGRGEGLWEGKQHNGTYQAISRPCVCIAASKKSCYTMHVPTSVGERERGGGDGFFVKIEKQRAKDWLFKGWEDVEKKPGPDTRRGGGDKPQTEISEYIPAISKM